MLAQCDLSSSLVVVACLLLGLAVGKVKISGRSNSIRFGGAAEANGSIMYEESTRDQQTEGIFVFDKSIHAPNLQQMERTLNATLAGLEALQDRLQLLEAAIYTEAPTHLPTHVPTANPTNAPTGSPTINPTSVPTTASPTPSFTFASLPALQTAVDAWCIGSIAAEATYGSISAWGTSDVTSFAYLFSNKAACNPDISAWDSSRVTSMEEMFLNAAAFNSPLTNWDTSLVLTMASMLKVRIHSTNRCPTLTPQKLEISRKCSSKLIPSTSLWTTGKHPVLSV